MIRLGFRMAVASQQFGPRASELGMCANPPFVSVALDGGSLHGIKTPTRSNALKVFDRVGLPCNEPPEIPSTL
jgi:hypothetical protein